ncbi:MAG: AMP-binding protein [Clostridia bacterium]|nr:AMP-binding protein [Clostridia bacterium]
MDRKHKVSKKLYEYDEFRNLKEMLNNSKEKFGECPAFKFKTEIPGKLRIETYKEFIDKVEALGTALISIGLQGKRIAVIGENRYEWALAYLSVVCGTGIIVPLDKSLPKKELLSLVERSEVEAIFYSEKYNAVMEEIKSNNIGKVNFFISMDANKTVDGIFSQNELVELGTGLIKNGAKSFIESNIDNDEMSIILFTSGTTSYAKAVMLSHTNIVSNIHDVASIFDLGTKDTMLSFLPLHHTFECTVGFLYPFSVGASIAYCEGIRHIADNIKEYQVSAMISVPLLFESIYKQMMHKIDKQGKTKKVKFGIIISNTLRKIGIDKRKFVFKDIHEALGGKLRLCVTGAAALDSEVEKGFNDIGIEVYQGYGLTETSPVVAAEHRTCSKPGSIGQLLPSFEGKIDNPNDQGIGELAVKGPCVMLGYYGNKDATDEVIKDGWFYTGDLAYFDKDDYIFITGRKKDVIVLKNGKNIYPEEVEALIDNIEGIKESFVFGKPDQDDEINLKLAAKIVYDKEIMKKNFGLENEEEIKEKIWKDIKEVNKTMPTYKYIKEIYITDKELIRTTTTKIKRYEEIKTIQV